MEASRPHDRQPTLLVFGDSLSDNGNLFGLLGFPPSPPYWNGRASNGPTYAEQLARSLHMALDDRAFVGAQASDDNPGALTDPSGNGLPINLPEQILGYVASLSGHPVHPGTTAVINIGANDYSDYLFFSDHTAQPQAIVQNVIGAIASAVAALEAAGVSRIVLFTLPDLSATPRYADPSIPASAAAAAHDLVVANNAALQHLAAAHPDITLVDTFSLLNAVGADPQAFGFTAPLTTMLRDQIVAGTDTYAPNEVAFFDGEHPTYAGHGIFAAFADAILTSDHTTMLDGTQRVVRLGPGDDFVFAKALDPSRHDLSGDYTIRASSGNDVILAGDGNVTVHGGPGDDLIASGAGSSSLAGGSGADVLATNSLGHNTLSGGSGGDALIANRGGSNVLRGGSGDDLIVLKENAALAVGPGTFAFGQQTVEGGRGTDTLRFVINDQSNAAQQAFMSEFLRVEAAFDFARAHHLDSFTIDGLQVTGVERLELEVDSVSRDPQTPYLITHHVELADGAAAPHVSSTLQQLLHSADQWGLLTV